MSEAAAWLTVITCAALWEARVSIHFTGAVYSGVDISSGCDQYAVSWSVSTAGIRVHIGPSEAGECTRSARRRVATQLVAASSPAAQMNRFSPLIRDPITSPGNHDRSRRPPSLLASPTKSSPVSIVPSWW